MVHYSNRNNNNNSKTTINHNININNNNNTNNNSFNYYNFLHNFHSQITPFWSVLPIDSSKEAASFCLLVHEASFALMSLEDFKN